MCEKRKESGKKKRRKFRKKKRANVKLDEEKLKRKEIVMTAPTQNRANLKKKAERIIQIWAKKKKDIIREIRRKNEIKRK